MPDQHNDDEVERFARVAPPRGHVARVLARSGPSPNVTSRVTVTLRPVPWRWVMPVAATMAIVAGAFWQADRSSRPVALPPPVASAEWRGKGVDLPVLPPRAYWQMSAVEEFAQLRPETRAAETVATVAANAGPRATPAAAASSPVAVAGAGPDAAPPVEAGPIAIEPLAVAPLGAAAALDLVPIGIAPIPVLPLTQEAP